MWGLGDQMFAEGSLGVKCVGSGGLSIVALGYRDIRRIVARSKQCRHHQKCSPKSYTSKAPTPDP